MKNNVLDTIIEDEFQAKAFINNLPAKPDYKFIIDFKNAIWNIYDLDKRVICSYFFSKAIYQKYAPGFDVELLQYLHKSLEDLLWHFYNALSELDGIASSSVELMRFVKFLKNDNIVMSNILACNIVRDKSDEILFYLYHCSKFEEHKNVFKNIILQKYSNDIDRCIDFTKLPQEVQDSFFLAAAEQFKQVRLTPVN